MYVVDSSARKATITLTGEEVAVKFPCTYSVFGIKGGSMLLYPKSGMAQGDDGVYDTAEGDGSVIMCLHYQADTVYIKGTGDCVIWAGNSTLDNPFKVGGKGGGGSGGDNTHYKGTTTTAIENGSTTNPITIDGEDYTAVFGDIVVYGYTEFVFDGTAWSEFGRPFDTTPTSGSANAVTSDGVYKRTPWARTTQNGAISGEFCTATSAAVAAGRYANATAYYAAAFGESLVANQRAMTALGKWNKARTGDLFNIGNGTSASTTNNIVEVNSTEMNVNGDIKCHNLVVPVGGYSETVLKQVGVYNWDGLVNSVLVTASEMAEYDSFIFVYGYCDNSSDRTLLTNWGFTIQTIPSSVTVDGNNIKLNIASGNSSPVCFTCGLVDNDFKLKHIDGSMSNYTFGIAKVIGIKYPKLYVAPQTLNNTRSEPAEEDEMR